MSSTASLDPTAEDRTSTAKKRDASTTFDRKTGNITSGPSHGQASASLDAASTTPRTHVEIDGATRVSIIGLFTLGVLAALYFAQALLIPLTLAVLLFLTFRPVVRWGARHRIPAALSAAVIVIGLVAAIAGIFYTLSGPVTDAAENAPEIAAEVQERFEGVRGRFEDMLRLPSEAAEGATEEATGSENEERAIGIESPRDPSGDTEAVVVQTDDGREIEFVQAIALNVAGVFTTMLVTLVLLFFLLASGSLFYEKLVQSFDRLEDKKQALFAVHQVERDISRYLLTITIINWGLGCAIGGAMWLLGMPNPLLWLVLAAVLNYLPYVGAIIGTATAFVVAVLTFPTPQAAAVVPLVYYSLTTLEGSVVTPYFVGRRLQINAVSVFIFVALGAWIWGIFGALMAVPLLVVIKEVFSSVPGGEGVANFLADRPATPGNSDEPKTA